jgi:hypothetical protein
MPDARKPPSAERERTGDALREIFDLEAHSIAARFEELEDSAFEPSKTTEIELSSTMSDSVFGIVTVVRMRVADAAAIEIPYSEEAPAIWKGEEYERVPVSPLHWRIYEEEMTTGPREMSQETIGER